MAPTLAATHPLVAAIYTEAPLDAKASLFEYNFAEECGGMMYAGAFGGDRKLSGCKIDVNQEVNCKQRPATPGEVEAPKGGKGAVAAKKKKTGDVVYEFEDEDDDAPPPLPKGPPPRPPGSPDPTGAIFEGPRLSGFMPTPPKSETPKQAKSSAPKQRAQKAAGEQRTAPPAGDETTSGKTAAADEASSSQKGAGSSKRRGERYDPREGAPKGAPQQSGSAKQTGSAKQPTAASAPPPVKKKKLSSIQSAFDELERIAEEPDNDDLDELDVSATVGSEPRARCGLGPRAVRWQSGAKLIEEPNALAVSVRTCAGLTRDPPRCATGPC